MLDRQTDRIWITGAAAGDKVGAVAEEHVDVAGTEDVSVDSFVDRFFERRAVAQRQVSDPRLLGERESARNLYRPADVEPGLLDRHAGQTRGVVEGNRRSAHRHGERAAAELAEIDDGRFVRCATAVDLDPVSGGRQAEGFRVGLRTEPGQRYGIQRGPHGVVTALVGDVGRLEEGDGEVATGEEKAGGVWVGSCRERAPRSCRRVVRPRPDEGLDVTESERRHVHALGGAVRQRRHDGRRLRERESTPDLDEATDRQQGVCRTRLDPAAGEVEVDRGVLTGRHRERAIGFLVAVEIELREVDHAACNLLVGAAVDRHVDATE